MKLKKITNQDTFKRLENQPWIQIIRVHVAYLKNYPALGKEKDKWTKERHVYKRAYPNDNDSKDKELELGVGVGEGARDRGEEGEERGNQSIHC